jgi:hypothetical protein
VISSKTSDAVEAPHLRAQRRLDRIEPIVASATSAAAFVLSLFMV